VGCAVLFTVRCVADYVILSWLGDRRVARWRSVTIMLLLLSVSAYVAGLWPIEDWRWWASGSALAAALLTVSWAVLPESIRGSLVQRARGIWDASGSARRRRA